MDTEGDRAMLCAFDFDGTLADSKPAYYKTVLRYAAQNKFPMPSQQEMHMAFGNPNPPLFKGWGDPVEFLPHLSQPIVGTVEKITKKSSLVSKPHAILLLGFL